MVVYFRSKRNDFRFRAQTQGNHATHDKSEPELFVE
jgi:hypothetical protein